MRQLTSWSSRTLAFLLLYLRLNAQAADCSCGYLLDSPSLSEPQLLFTQAFETDFLHVDSQDHLNTWQPQAYTQTPQAANGPYGKIFDVDNVITNPLSKGQWSGQGAHGGDPGLQLWVNSTLVPGSDDTFSIRGAEIVTTRSDILYGSFSIAMKLSPITGTCGAFFWYRDDTSEIDMEFLSKQFAGSNSSVNLVIQSSQNGNLGYTAPGSPNFDLQALDFNPSSEYVEYRFDWAPGRVNFYADNKLLTSMTDNIPNAQGRLHVSHWSNGNTGWSSGPPQVDAVLTISYVKMYFNTSDATRIASYQNTCGGPNASARVCQIPQSNGHSDPQSSDGNATGETPFLTNSTTGTPDSAAMKENSPLYALFWCLVVAVVIS